MGSVGADLEALQNRINNLRPYKGSSTEVQTVLIQDKSKTDKILQVLDTLESKNQLSQPEVKTVYLDRVYTKQPWLEKAKLNEYVDKPIHELAEGYMLDGDVYITDGNHRIALAKLNNQGTVRMKVIDLNKKKKSKMFDKNT